MQVQFDAITKTFGRAPRTRVVLDRVSLALTPTAFHVLRGPSGAGKSTLLAIAAGLIEASAGSVRFDGHEPWREREAKSARFRREHVGVVFQTGRVLPGLNVVENVELPLRFRQRKDARERAQAALERFGIGELARAMPDQLSIGELQRASVARALLAEPAVVFADEPTSNLDDVSAAIVRDALRDAWRRGATVLVATHDEALVAPGDHVIALNEGRLA
ncbi:MAG: ABC transporter ATP-binding protein [Planctomycetes bacterium]|nr:ABC transporter ATP-binding protein [Planctomycetota bacterium]